MDPLNLSAMFADLNIEETSVLDLGCGTYASPLSSQMKDLPFARLISVDIHLPVIRTLQREVDNKPFAAKHHITRARDAREHVKVAMEDAYDVVLILDMLEHLPIDDGVALLKQCMRIAKKRVMVWLPIGECPQGESDGNQHQVHQSTWEVKDLEKLGFLVSEFEDFHTQFNPPVTAAWAVWHKGDTPPEVVEKPTRVVSKDVEIIRDKPIETILVDRLDVHGDVLVATSVLPGLREKYPDAKIDWRVRKGYGFALEQNPHIHKIITYTGGGHPGDARVVEDYDLVVTPDHHMSWNKPMAAVHCEQAGVPLHKPELYLTDEEWAAVPDEHRHAILVANHAGWGSRVCPALNEALKELSEYHPFVQIDNGADLFEGIDHPELTLRQAAAYMAYANLYIGIDTVFMHMAVAWNIPMVLCMGPTDQHTQYIPGATVIKPYEWKNPAEPYPDTKEGIQIPKNTIIAGIRTKLFESGEIVDKKPRRKMISYATEKDYK